MSNPLNSFSGSGVGLHGVDAATLDGLERSEFATEAELASVPGPAVHWGNLTSVPAGVGAYPGRVGECMR